MSNIKVQCIDQAIGFLNTPVISSGNVNYDTITFEFCSKWDGFTKTAIFYRTKDEVYYQILNESNTCNIPNEVLGEKGVIYIGVFGSSGDTTITSQVLKYRIDEGAITEDLRPTDPTPDIYDQIIGLCSQIRKEQTDFITAWDKTIKDTRDELIEEVEKIIENEGVGDAETIGGYPLAVDGKRGVISVNTDYGVVEIGRIIDFHTKDGQDFFARLAVENDGNLYLYKADGTSGKVNDGGNADTVDGKHASAFMASSLGECTGEDLLTWLKNQTVGGYFTVNPTVTTSGCPVNGAWYYGILGVGVGTHSVILFRSYHSGVGFKDEMYFNSTSSGTWRGWKKSANADEVLPLSGGSLTGTLELSGSSAVTRFIQYLGETFIRNRVDSTNYRDLRISPTRGLTYDIVTNGSVKSNTVLHTGNSSPVVPTNVDPGVGASVTYEDGTVIFVYEEE